MLSRTGERTIPPAETYETTSLASSDATGKKIYLGANVEQHGGGVVQFHHQAYDPALELRDGRTTSPEKYRSLRLALLRSENEREIAIGLLFGRSLVMPVGQATDSLLFLDMFQRFFAAYDARKDAIDANFGLEGLRFRPFRVTLYPGMERISDVARLHRWGPARFAMFNHLPVEEQGECVKALCAALADGKYKEAGRISGRPGMDEVYRQLDIYFDKFAGIAPHPSIEPNYLEIINKRIGKWRISDPVRSNFLLEARDRIISRLDADSRIAEKGMTGLQAAARLRGAWYYHDELIGEDWPIVAADLDAAHASQMMAQHDASIGNFVTPIASGGLPDLALQLATPAPTVDWGELMKQFEDPGLRLQIVSLQNALSHLRGAERIDRYRQHAEKILPYAKGIGLRGEQLAAMIERLKRRTKWLRAFDPIATKLVEQGAELAVKGPLNTVIPGSGGLAKALTAPIKSLTEKDRVADQVILGDQWIRRQYRRLHLKHLGPDLRRLGPHPEQREFLISELRQHAPYALDADIRELASVASRGQGLGCGLVIAESGEFLSLAPELLPKETTGLPLPEALPESRAKKKKSRRPSSKG